MNEERKYGRTDFSPVAPLPEMPIDLADYRTLPPTLGKTETPVHVLRECVFDVHAAKQTPALQLKLHLRSGISATVLALDLFGLYGAVNQLELSHRGAGLIPD